MSDFFLAAVSSPMFESVSENKNAWRLPEYAMNLPSYHDMTFEEIERVCDVTLDYLNGQT